MLLRFEKLSSQSSIPTKKKMPRGEQFKLVPTTGTACMGLFLDIDPLHCHCKLGAVHSHHLPTPVQSCAHKAKQIPEYCVMLDYRRH